MINSNPLNTLIAMCMARTTLDAQSLVPTSPTNNNHQFNCKNTVEYLYRRISNSLDTLIIINNL